MRSTRGPRFVECPDCGKRIQQTRDDRCYYCRNCGITWFMCDDEGNLVKLESTDEFDDEEDDDSESGCYACGNDAYPHCKDSCPLFDD